MKDYSAHTRENIERYDRALQALSVAMETVEQQALYEEMRASLGELQGKHDQFVALIYQFVSSIRDDLAVQKEALRLSEEEGLTFSLALTLVRELLRGA